MIKKRTRFLSVMLTLAMIVGLMPAMTLTASATDTPHSHSLSAGGDPVDFNQKITSSSGSLTTGNYYLDEDVDLTTNLTIGSGVTVNLCLNGHVLKGNGSGSVITINGRGTLNLCDCSTNTHRFEAPKGNGTDPGTGLWVLKETGDASDDDHVITTVTGGAITGGTGNRGGGVNMTSGTFNMHSGNIVGNSSNEGGGVYNYNDSYASNVTFNMYGGRIIGNSATGHGGGVFNQSDMGAPCFCTMTGGLIAYNSTAGTGGGVSNWGNFFNMSGGNIIGNSASSNGGGVACEYSTSGTMSGGSIIGNSSACDGGGVCLVGAFFTHSGGSIIGNSAARYGGGMFSCDPDTIKIKGEPVITGNTKGNVVQNVFLYDGNVIRVTGALSTGASIGLTRDVAPTSEISSVTVAEGSDYTITTTDAACFFSDDATCYTTYNSASKKVMLNLHQHSFNYALDTTNTTNDTIEANCTAAGCYLTDLSGGSVQIKAPRALTYTGSDLNAILVDTLVNDAQTAGYNNIKYEYNATANNNYTEVSSHSAIGFYKASITLGTQTAYVEYEIIKGTSGGGGGGSSEITVPVSGEKNSVQVKAEVSGSKASVKEITAEDIAKAAGSKAGAEISIDVSGLGKNINEVTLTNKTVKNLADAEAVGTVELKLSNATVTIDDKTLDALVAQAGGNDITLHCDLIAASTTNSSQQKTVGALTSPLVIDTYFMCGGKRISDFKGGQAVLAVKYALPAGKTAAQVTGFYVADNGEKTAVPCTYSDGKAYLTASHFSYYVVSADGEAAACDGGANCPTASFSDLNASKWYHEATDFVLSKGLMKGIEDKIFSPNGDVTRGMLVTILWRQAGEPASNGAMSFADVPEGKWYTEAIRWAAANEIVSGYSAEKFGPNDSITREQLATIIYNYEKKMNNGGFTGEWMFNLEFSDAGQISDYANEAMHWCVMNKIVNGFENNTLAPQGTATRAQVAQMLMNYLNK